MTPRVSQGNAIVMLRISDISFSIEGKQLFKSASATIPTGHKVGFVGRNGTGKSTLFKLITGELALDDGDVSWPKRSRIGGVAQEAEATDESLLETVLAADVERTELMHEAETATDPDRIGEIYTRLTDIDAYSAEARASAILQGLGFDTAAQAQSCKEFSGGWRMRVALAGVLFSEPEILMLDEPTNYLDLEGTIWLETYLAKYPHTVIVISHDRALLNSSVNSILHLHDKQLTLYQGNYDTFDNTRRARLAEQASMAKKQDAQRAHMQSFVERFRAKASKAKQAQSRLKMLEKMEPIAAGMERGVAEFNFPDAEELSPPIIRMDDVSTGYGDKPILSNLNLRIDPDDRIALLGANGQGKSTFSKLLAGELKPMAGKMVQSSKLRIGYFAQHQVDALNLDETPLQHISSIMSDSPVSKRRAKLAAGGVGVDQVDVKVEKLSGGQKARLAMLLTTIYNPHILLLDEPTNHLDIESRDALVRALAAYNGAVILVSHDPHLINAVADRLWLVKDGTVAPYTDDMDAYRKLLLSERGSGGVDAKKKADEKKAETAAKKTPNLGMLQRDVEKAEDRMQKLEEMQAKIDTRLADPELYKGESYKVDQLNKKRAEIVEGVARAEAIWSAAIEKLETAKGA